MVENKTLLIFSDFSAELSKRRKAFSPICTALVKKNTKFLLLYPAKLSIMSETGGQLTFLDPEDVETYMQQMDQDPQPDASPLQQQTPCHRKRLDGRWPYTPRRQHKNKKRNINP